MALSATHAPQLPLSEERPDPGAGRAAPRSLRAWPWLWENPGRAPGLTWGWGRRDGGVGRNGCQVLGKAAAYTAPCPGQILSPLVSLGSQWVPGSWWCWGWPVVVLGTGQHYGAQPWSLVLCMTGDAHVNCGEQGSAQPWSSPLAVWWPPQGRHRCASWECFSLSQCPSPQGCS